MVFVILLNVFTFLTGFWLGSWASAPLPVPSREQPVAQVEYQKEYPLGDGKAYVHKEQYLVVDEK